MTPDTAADRDARERQSLSLYRQALLATEEGFRLQFAGDFAGAWLHFLRATEISDLAREIGEGRADA